MFADGKKPFETHSAVSALAAPEELQAALRHMHGVLSFTPDMMTVLIADMALQVWANSDAPTVCYSTHYSTSTSVSGCQNGKLTVGDTTPHAVAQFILHNCPDYHAMPHEQQIAPHRLSGVHSLSYLRMDSSKVITETAEQHRSSSCFDDNPGGFSTTSIQLRQVALPSIDELRLVHC